MPRRRGTLARPTWGPAQESSHRGRAVRSPPAPAHRLEITPPFVNGVRRLFAAAELVTITGRVAACRDPKDDKFLELAVNGEADLLVLDTFRAIPILPPAAFLRSAAP